MCLYVLREKCTGVQKNSAFGALREVSENRKFCSRCGCWIFPSAQARRSRYFRFRCLHWNKRIAEFFTGYRCAA